MDANSKQQPKTFRRGETIFKAGEAVTHLYLIQSGLATVTVPRAGKQIEIVQIGVGQLLGEEALWGRRNWSANAVANNDVRALPVEVGQAFGLLSGGQPLIKIFLKGLIEKQRMWWGSLVDVKTENDPTPCPPAKVTQLFAVIYHAASYVGTRKNGEMVVVWPSFKKYCQRTFLESPVRLEQAVYILVKLGFAELEMIPCETDPEAPDELGFVHFKNLDVIRDFYEFYRARFFGHAGKADVRPTDTRLGILKEIEEWNKRGKVVLPTAENADGEAA